MTGGNTNHYTTADLLSGTARRVHSSLEIAAAFVHGLPPPPSVGAWGPSAEQQPEDQAAMTTGKDDPVQGVTHPTLHVAIALRSESEAGGRTFNTGARRANPET